MNILVFQNIRFVILGEELLVKNGISLTIRPVPSQISSECGMCIEIGTDDLDTVKKLLDDCAITFQLVKI